MAIALKDGFPIHKAAWHATVIASDAFAVTSGELIVVVANVNAGDTIASIADTEGNTYSTPRRYGSTSKAITLCWAQSKGTEANNVVTVTMDASGTAEWKLLTIYVATPDSGETLSEDGYAGAYAAWQTSHSSGNFTTAGTDVFSVAGASPNSATPTWSSQVIGADSDGTSQNTGGTHIETWHKIFASAQTDIAAEATSSAGCDAAIAVIAVKSVAAGGGLLIPVAQYYHNQART